jgi:leader peptidase (prepilin peptidase)/N-methyltransferase
MNLTLLQFLGWGTQLLFVMAYGACVGSLINVLVYRLPKGMSVITPPSRCPGCSTKLAWKDNIPVFGWLALRGKCRYCGIKISCEYPLVEAFVAVLFALFFTLWYLVPADAVWLGVPWGEIAPEWARNGFVRTWPEFVVLLMLVGCLVAMTIVDAKTYTIPLELAWFPSVLAVVILPVHAAWIGASWRYTAAGEVWSIPTPGVWGWGWIGGSIGAVIGLGVANVALRGGWIRRSFADYDEWEQKAIAERQAEEDTSRSDVPPTVSDDPTDLWIDYPHARREMFKELVFLSPVITLGIVGAWVARSLAGPWNFDPSIGVSVPPHEAPLWLMVLAGVLIGYLVGGGVIWAVRIFGSLAFGKEAMGLGDVHLMAAVGACLGWIDPTLAFFGAAFLAVLWGAGGAVFKGAMKRALPFGPYLAAATVLVVLGKPWVEVLLEALFKTPVDLP